MALDGNQVQVAFTVSGTNLGSDSSAAAEGAQPRRHRVHASHVGRFRLPARSNPAVPDQRPLQPGDCALGPRIRDPALQHPPAREGAQRREPGLQRNESQRDDQRLQGPGRHLAGDRQRGARPGNHRLAGSSAQRRPVAAKPTALQPLRSERTGPLRAPAAAVGYQPAPHGDRHAERADHIAPFGQPARARPLCCRTSSRVSAILAKDSNDFGQAIPVLAAFSRYSANASGSGAFVDVSVPTLLIPDNLAVQCSAPGAMPSKNPQVGCRP